MKIGVFGGTFDPVHNGHLALARTALAQLGLDKVLFLPAFIPPHKTDREAITPAPFRYRMVEMAIQEESQFEISDMELNRPNISYTVDSLKELRSKFPGAEFYLILGEDSLKQFPSWKEPEQILKMARLAAARRPGYELGDFDAKVEWLNMPNMPISASNIRSQFALGTSPGSEVLPEKVENYIRKMKLYGAS